MPRTTAAVLVLLLAAAPAAADEARQYEECMALAASAPAEGWETALAWTSLGGGEAARHCAAVALIGLGHHAEAASRLERLARDSRRAASLRAGMLAQAAEAWLRAGQTERALATLDAAVALTPDEPELRVDRALAHGEYGDFHAALADLDAALALAPGRPALRAAALALRAAAHRSLDALAAAENDVIAALEIDPDQPDALLESGILHRLRGETHAARRDWMRILEGAPDSPAADSARRHIEALDLTPAR